jgi:hypothetical protein
MKRYILTIIVAIAIIGLYYFIDIRLFSLDLTREVKEALFIVSNKPAMDRTTVVYSVGKLGPEELETKIDSLLTTQARKIGINLCHYERPPVQLMKKYKGNSKIIFANCSDSGSGTLSQIIEDRNTVTHFKTDKPDYFELQLVNFYGRGNNEERINYGPSLRYPFSVGELTDSYHWLDAEFLAGKTILLGYMGDYLTDSIHYYQNCRITPMNRYYGESNIPPDMYDIEISANILRTINANDFITEINPFVRVFIILAFSVFNVLLLTFVKTKWTIANLLIATVLFVLLTGIGPFLILYLFDKGYFLEIDELPLILLITTVFTVLLNISKKRSSPQQNMKATEKPLS